MHFYSWTESIKLNVFQAVLPGVKQAQQNVQEFSESNPRLRKNCCTSLAIISWALVKNMIIQRKVPNVEFNFNIRFCSLMHWSKVKMDKLGSFVSEEAYTILT